MIFLVLALSSPQATEPVQVAVPAFATYVDTRSVAGRPSDEIVAVGRQTVVVRLDPETGLFSAVAAARDLSGLDQRPQVLDVDADGRDDIVFEDHILFDETPRGFVTSSFQRVDLASRFSGERAVRRTVDLDGNGWPDVLLVDTSGAPLQALLATGPRSLVGPVSLSTPAVYAAEAFDFDGDGDLDLAVVTAGDRLQVWRNDGAPFPWPVAFDVATVAGTLDTALRASDIDGDGALDLVVARGELRVHLGGANGFATAVTVPAAGLSGEIFFVDADGDGDRDVVGHAAWALGGSPEPARWLERVGPLSFAASAVDVAAPAPFFDVTMADLGGSGTFSLVGTDTSSNVPRVIDFPIGAPVATSRLIQAGGGGPLGAGDLDGDGDPDVVVARPGGVVVCERVAPSEYRETRAFDDPNAPLGLPQYAVVIEAGVPGQAGSIAYVNFAGELVAYPDPLGASVPAPSVLASGLDPFGAGPAAEDFDGDGDDDVLVVRADATGVDFVEQVAPRTFAAAVALLTVPAGVQFLQAEWADVDGDGDLDLMAVERDSVGSYVRIYLAANGGLAPSTSIQRVDGFRVGLGVAALRAGGLDILVAERVTSGSNIFGRITGFLVDSTGALVSPVVRVETALGRTVVDFAVVPESPFPMSVPVLHVLSSSPSSLATRLDSYTEFGVPAFVPALPDSRTSSLDALDLDLDGSLELVFGSVSGVWVVEADPYHTAIVGPSVAFCFAQTQSSSGRAARLDVLSTSRLIGPLLTLDQLRLEAYDLPPLRTVLFLASQGVGFTPGAGGALGTLCLGGTVGRFLGPGQLQTSSAWGTATLDVDSLTISLGGTAVSAVRGANWTFQAWYRDSDGLAPVSRMTNAIAATL